jgi:RsiW-degrading membrane proteinase PrsW (M82 family)
MAKPDNISVPLHKPKLQEKLFFLFSGMVVSIPLTLFITNFSDYLQPIVPSNYLVLVYVVLLAPLIEEFSKAYPLFYRHAETERSIFTLGFLVGLGFGIVEFIEYVVLLRASILLRLPGIFFHASTTSIVAFGISRKRSFWYYLIAFALHMSNNLFATTGWTWIIGGPAAIGLAYLLSVFFYGKTRESTIPFK